MDKIIIISSAQHRYLEEPFTLSTATDFSLGENLSGSFNPDPIQSDPTTEDPPPGFEDNRGKGKGVRRSPRISEKSGGRYISAEDKARVVLGFDCIPISPKRLKRKNNRQEEINLSYLQSYDPLTDIQAEVLVNTAGAEFESDLQGKISNIITAEGAMAAAKQAIL